MGCFCFRKKKISPIVIQDTLPHLELPPPKLVPLRIKIPKYNVTFSSLSSRRLNSRRNEKLKKKSYTR